MACCASLVLPATPRPRPPGAPSGLQLHARSAPARDEVEDYIRRIYRQRFGAELQQFAPMLVSLRDADGELIAAAGYRPGGDEALFLERYLDRPVDVALSAHAAAPVQRRHLVEVGHLAGSRAGAGRALILRLGPHLAGQGFQWVVGTLTEELRHLFLRLGIAPVALGVADPAQLGEQAAAWGTYYEHRPLVLAGQLDVALATLARRRAQA